MPKFEVELPEPPAGMEWVAEPGMFPVSVSEERYTKAFVLRPIAQPDMVDVRVTRKLAERLYRVNEDPLLTSDKHELQYALTAALAAEQPKLCGRMHYDEACGFKNRDNPQSIHPCIMPHAHRGMCS